MSDVLANDWEDLVVRVRARDQHAAKELVEALYPQVIRIVRAHLPKRMDEEDLAQEVFMKMFTKIDQFSGAVPFPHWVARIALLSCIDQLRRQKVRPEDRLSDLSLEQVRVLERAQGEAASTLGVDATAAKELLGRLMETLNPEDRVLITMLELEEKSVDEIAALTGWNRTLIRVRAFRARKKLKKALDNLTEEEKR